MLDAVLCLVCELHGAKEICHAAQESHFMPVVTCGKRGVVRFAE
jgi:hypothetical protein